MNDMKYMLVQFSDNNRQWYYGSESGLTAMLNMLTDVKSVEINEITNRLTDY